MSNNKPTYLFYDIETTGLNKCFDQVLQFAYIRTDVNLKEIDRGEILIKLNPDVIPSPYAVITHRIGPAEFSNGLSEYDAMQKIHALMNEPGTISLGYNTLGFDDEFLRFSFYKNLLPPYTHQYANQCGRMDLYPIALIYYLFKKDIMQWPDGNLKLENINTANQFAKGQAHNAMVDVEITLALAKKLAEDKTIWDFAVGFFDKKTDQSRMQAHQIGFLMNGKMGNAANYIAPVLSLGQHQHYKNQTLWLRLDDDKLSQTTLKSIKENTRVIKKRLGEAPIFLPIKDRYEKLLSDNRREIVLKNKNWIAENKTLLSEITQYHQHEKYPEVPECDADAALYQINFPSNLEEKLFRDFHAATPEKKYRLAKQFPNPIRQAQAIRILARHFPTVLSEQDHHAFSAYLNSIPVNFRNEKKLTRDAALSEITEIEQKKTLDEAQKGLLIDLKKWVMDQFRGVNLRF